MKPYLKWLNINKGEKIRNVIVNQKIIKKWRKNITPKIVYLNLA